MRVGKLTEKEIKSCVLNQIKTKRDEVKVHAGLGLDCAVIKSNGYLTITTDPITAADKDIGSLAVNIAANDTYCNGGIPFAMTVTLLMPTKSNTNDIKSIMRDIEKEASKQNIEIIGGHTEFTKSVNRPICSIAMIGKTSKKLMSSKLHDGDSIIVTKGLGIEGTVILSNKIKLSSKDKKDIKVLKDSLSIRDEALVALKHKSRIHDITECGLIGALKEVLIEEKLGCEVDLEKGIINEITYKICKRFNLDPFRLISSGSLLIFTSHEKKVLKELKKRGILASKIGKVTNKNIVLRHHGKRVSSTVTSDELLKVM